MACNITQYIHINGLQYNIIQYHTQQYTYNETQCIVNTGLQYNTIEYYTLQQAYNISQYNTKHCNRPTQYTIINDKTSNIRLPQTVGKHLALRVWLARTACCSTIAFTLAYYGMHCYPAHDNHINLGPCPKSLTRSP